MNSNGEIIRGKKLLILGGNSLSCDIVKAARKLGVYTIVTDWNNPQLSPAKLIADEYWNISLMDYDKLDDNISKAGVNGIITGFSDSYLLPYQYLCERNNFPCYATKQQLEWTLDKSEFKKRCEKYGVPVVPEYSLEDFDPLQLGNSKKVIIKPVDNSGSRGISLCEKPDDFHEMLTRSLSFSGKKQVVIERYMECDDVSFEYTIQDGEATLSAICDRYIYKTKDGGSVTSKLIYPSKYLSTYLADTDRKVREMFHKEGLKNGVLFMQAFAENGHFYFYEMGYRLSGGRHFLFTDKENGRSAVKELIRFSLTGSMSPIRLSDIINPQFSDICCQVSVLCKSEEIFSISGQEELKTIPEIIDMSYYYQVGDKIGKQGTTAQIFSRIHIVAKSTERLAVIINTIKHVLRVENRCGHNIILDIN